MSRTPLPVTLNGLCQFIVPDTSLAGEVQASNPSARCAGSEAVRGGLFTGLKGAGDFELRCPDGVVLWGEAWGGAGVFVVDGAAAVRCRRLDGVPFLDVYVPGGAEAVAGMVGMRREMRVPAVDVLVVAALEHAHPEYNEQLRDHVQALSHARTLN